MPGGTSGNSSRSGTPPPPGDDDDDGDDDYEGAPPEEISVAEYKKLRDTDRWLDERIMVCDECAGELTAVVEDAEVGKDGKIRVPANPFPNGEASTSPIKLGRFAEDTATSQKRKEKGAVEAPRPRQQSPYSGTNPSNGGGVSANAENASRIAKQKAVPTPHVQMGEEVQASRSRVVILSTPEGGEEEAEL